MKLRLSKYHISSPSHSEAKFYCMAMCMSSAFCFFCRQPDFDSKIDLPSHHIHFCRFHFFRRTAISISNVELFFRILFMIFCTRLIMCPHTIERPLTNAINTHCPIPICSVLPTAQSIYSVNALSNGEISQKWCVQADVQQQSTHNHFK